MIKNKVLLIDLSYMLHRSLRAPELWELQVETASGEVIKTGGIYGVLNSLTKSLKKFPGYYPVFCSDLGLSARRLKEQPNYKGSADRANQSAKPLEEMTAEEMKQAEESKAYRDAYVRSKEELRRLADIMKIPYLELSETEGDDILAVCSAHPSTMEAVVVTDDRDLIQLIGLVPGKSIKNYRAMADEVLDTAWFNENYGNIDNFVLHKSICGDGSDNIPSVAPGVGGKTALEFINVWRTAGLSNEDISKGGEIESGIIGGGQKWEGRGNNRKLVEDTSPKYTTRALSTLHEHSGHKKATCSMINSLINTKQLRSNLEMIDLRKIGIEDVKRISDEYEKESAKIVGDISLMQVLPALGAYKIKDFDVSGFVGIMRGLLKA